MSPSLFSLANGILSIKGIPLLTETPNNVSFSDFFAVCQSSQAPIHLINQAHSNSYKGGFLGFTHTSPSSLLKNPLGQFNNRPFLSVFRFKTWWSTMWVGSNASDLQMETQWVLFNLHELNSYVLLIPLIEGPFRSALHPGPDNQVMIWAESGSEQVQTSSFKAVAYVHFGNNPYTLMKEAFTSIRVHLDTFRLLEEKSVPSFVDRFGWCTWDAFYLTVDPLGVWHGVKDFDDAGLPLRFLIIDDGWQSIDFDGGVQQNLITGGQQMTARLYRLQECERFRKYKPGSLLGKNFPPYDLNRTKKLILKQCEIDRVEKARYRAEWAGNTAEVAALTEKIESLQREINEMYQRSKDDEDDGAETNCDPEVGFKAFTKDLRTRFDKLDDIYVWQALCGAWGGVRPGATKFDTKVVPVKVSPGLQGTMEDLAVVKIVEGGIGLVHPDQAADFYDAMHSYLSSVGITGAKVDVVHVSLSIR